MANGDTEYDNYKVKIVLVKQVRLQEFGLWYAHMMLKSGLGRGGLYFDGNNSMPTMNIYYLEFIYITLFIIYMILLMIGIVLHTY